LTPAHVRTAAFEADVYTVTDTCDNHGMAASTHAGRSIQGSLQRSAWVFMVCRYFLGVAAQQPGLLGGGYLLLPHAAASVDPVCPVIRFRRRRRARSTADGPSSKNSARVLSATSITFHTEPPSLGLFLPSSVKEVIRVPVEQPQAFGPFGRRRKIAGPWP